jgi:hypothetical protein
VARVHLDAVAELGEPSERVEQALCSFRSVDREVGPSRLADEQRVAREDEPRLVATRPVDHGERAVLRPVAGRMNRSHDDVAEDDLLSVGERIVRERSVGGRVHPYRHAVLQREPAVAGDVVGVRVRLEDGNYPDGAPADLVEVRLDPVSRVDEDGEPGMLVADEVRRAPQVVVDELLEEHAADRSTEYGYFS